MLIRKTCKDCFPVLSNELFLSQRSQVSQDCLQKLSPGILPMRLLSHLHSDKKIMKQGRGYTLNGMRSKTYIESG